MTAEKNEGAMTTLEEAARACGEADGFDWDEEHRDGLSEVVRDEYRAQARAVLMAVRFETLEDFSGSVMAHRFWFNDRIDAILKDPTAAGDPA